MIKPETEYLAHSWDIAKAPHGLIHTLTSVLTHTETNCKCKSYSICYRLAPRPRKLLQYSSRHTPDSVSKSHSFSSPLLHTAWQITLLCKTHLQTWRWHVEWSSFAFLESENPRTLLSRLIELAQRQDLRENEMNFGPGGLCAMAASKNRAEQGRTGLRPRKASQQPRLAILRSACKKRAYPCG